MSLGKPYLQKLQGKLIMRRFSSTVDDSELHWHQDLEDRRVRVLEGAGWKFQIDNHLPQELKVGDTLVIPKRVWHRIIKGNSDLFIAIYCRKSI